MLVRGEGTDAYNAAICDALAADFAGARVIELPGGHMSPVVAMDRFLDEVRAFQRSADGIRR